MNTEIKNSIATTDKDAQYDEKAKKLLGHKIILAYILINTVDEFKGMNPKEVVSHIEGDPYVSVVPLDPGMTNEEKKAGTEFLSGMNTENSEINEGLIRFDIVFYVRMKDELSQIIINVEAQKSEPSDYDILNRAIFYVSRLISSQKGRDFVKSNYNDIKRVYSIWICMNMKDNTITHIHLTSDDIVGSYQWKGKLDLFNIVFIGLSEELPEKDEKYELHRLLGALLSAKLNVDEKLDIIETEFAIPLESDMRKDVNDMCNLSQGIKEKAFEEGTEKGIASTIIKMYYKGFSEEQIADIVDMELEKVRNIIAREEDK